MKIEETRAWYYAQLVVTGKKLAGNTEKLCCQRFLDDVERSKMSDYPYFYDAESEGYYLGIANSLTIATGETQRPLKTVAFQDFILGNLMCWKEKDTGYRRFRESYIQVARRNSKTFLSGILAVIFSSFFPMYNSRIFTAATVSEQAMIAWEEVAKFINSDPDLAELYKVSNPESTIYSRTTGTRIIACSRNIENKEGQENILSICDELHLHPSNNIYNVLFLGQANVNNALTSAISTAGFNLNSFGYDHYKFCKKVVEGAVTKETQFVFICEPDPDDDWWDPETWMKANPLQLFTNDYEPNEKMIERYRQMALTAKEKQGSELLNFATKVCNVWVELQENALVPMAKFNDCASKRTLEDMRGRQVFAGLDLSNSNDLTCVSLVFPPMSIDEPTYIYTKAYMPLNRMLDHEKTDKAPYRVWNKQGLITTTSTLGGLKTDHRYILEDLKFILNEYNLELLGIGYDPYGMGALLQDLEEFGTDVVSITQSALSLSETIMDFKATIESHQVDYNEKNGLLIWSAGNARLEENSYGEVKLTKEKPGKRIDVISSIIDAWKLYYLKKNEYTTDEAVDDYLTMLSGIGGK